MRRQARVVLSACLLVVACARAATAPDVTQATSAPPSAAASSSPLPSAEATGAPTASVAAPAPAPACPENMLLVEGDYCESLEVDCLEKWHAPQNKLWVCERVREPTRCLGKTRRLRFCIDRYEFPNARGVRPMVMQNFFQAQLHCAKLGKRMCTESEWTKACEGPDNKPFPYGYVRDATICHGDQPYGFPDKSKVIARDPDEIERLWQGKRSGASPKCVSDHGVSDMAGNADELASSETYGKGPKSDFANVTTGGPWYKGVRNMCRPKIYSHDESFAYYYLSWRCCSEPDGAPNEPRAPKQIKRGKPMEWSEIIHIANHSWNLPLNPLVPGQPGYNAAGADRPPPRAPKP